MNQPLIKIRFVIVITLVVLSLYLSAQQRSEKRGIAFGHNTEADFQAVSSGISWWYNWYVEPENSVKNNYENYSLDFVPMVWNASSDTSKLRAYLKTHPNVNYILGFNEPNFKTQANMLPAQAAASWPRIEELANEFDLKIVGPAVNYCDQCVDIPGTTSDSDPVAYLDAFFNACPTCRVDYIGLHNYMCYTGPLADYIARFKKYGKKIWLTEFACWDQSTITLDMQKNLVIGAIDYLENDTTIFRYSWFNGDRKGNWPYIDLYGKNAGELTELGQLYVNFSPFHNDNYYFEIPTRIEAESYSIMSGIQLEATQDFDGIANVGYFDGGDWLQYNLNVEETGNYYLYLRISSNSNTSVLIKEADSVLTTINIPSSGGWQNWKTYVEPLTLEKGQHKLQVYTPTGQLNINWLAFTREMNTPPTVVADDDIEIILPQNSVFLTCNASDPDGNQLTYKWTKQSGANNAVIGEPNESYTAVSGLTKGSYYFKITVSDGIETVNDLVKVTVKDPVGVRFEDEVRFQLFPNPTFGILTIRLNPEDEDLFISLISTDGKILLKDKIPAGECLKELNIEHFRKGVYMLRIYNRIRTFQKTIVRQ